MTCTLRTYALNRTQPSDKNTSTYFHYRPYVCNFKCSFQHVQIIISCHCQNKSCMLNNIQYIDIYTYAVHNHQLQVSTVYSSTS